MHPIVENIMQRPTSHKVAGWLLLIIFVGYVFWQFFYKSKHQEHTKLQEKIENLQAEIVKEQRVARNLKKFKDEVKDLEIKLKFALSELPDKREIPDLLSSISNLARDAGLNVKLFKPAPEVVKDFYAEVPVSVGVEGTFHQVATFFDEVGQLSRIVNISQIALKNPKASDSAMTVASDCLATTFRYLDDAERAQNQAATDASAQGGRRRK